MGPSPTSWLAPSGRTIKSTHDAGLPPGLLGDAGRLRQVLLNLLSNAVKFTSAGGVSVECRCVDQTETKATIEWVITDTGIGIAPERISGLFHDYMQADITINRRFGGTGLGLSICRRIMDKMGGSIEVTSTLGVGTTMRCRIEVPLAEAIGHEQGSDDPEAELKQLAVELGRPLRILITDDNATNRLVAARMLQDIEVQISTAADGADAVERTTGTSFDVILMDVRMPEMDGLAASRAIRERGLKVPIIAFTANAFEDDREACRVAGMNDFVAKPVRKHLLVAAIIRALKGAVQGNREEGAAAELGPGPRSTLADEADSQLVNRDEYDALEEALGQEGMREALGLFIDETAARLVALRGYRLEGERETIQREAHTVKGAAASFGFLRLTGLAKWLEYNADNIDAAGLEDTVCRMEDAFSLTCEELAPRSLVA